MSDKCNSKACVSYCQIVEYFSQIPTNLLSFLKDYLKDFLRLEIKIIISRNFLKIYSDSDIIYYHSKLL